MADLNSETLFGEESIAEFYAWPAGHGSRPQLIERTLFGEWALWRVFPWPEGYGGSP